MCRRSRSAGFWGDLKHALTSYGRGRPRSSLSMAKLNRARSRTRPSNSNRVLIDQTCFGRKGGLAPIILPLFQDVRLLLTGAHGYAEEANGTKAICLPNSAPH